MTVNERFRDVLPLVAWAAALGAAIVAFTAMGAGQLAAPPVTDPGAWSGWADDRDPIVATVALLRLVVLALAWYLAGATLVGALARVARLTTLVRLADPLTVPMVRRVLQASLGVGLATSVVVSTTAAARPSAAPVLAAATGEEAEAPTMRPLPPRMAPVPLATDTHTPTDTSQPTDTPSPTDTSQPTDPAAPTDHAPASPTPSAGTGSPTPAPTGTTASPPTATTPSPDDTPTQRHEATHAPPGMHPLDVPSAPQHPTGAGTDAPDDPEAAPPDTPPAPAHLPTAGSAATATVTVRPGDHLWSIAEHHLADVHGRAVDDDAVAVHWRRLIEANRDRLVDPANPDLVLPGQQFVLPDAEVDG